jgi:hypothetical protein
MTQDKMDASATAEGAHERDTYKSLSLLLVFLI